MTNWNFRIDRLCVDGLSAETLNALHACREGHPLGRNNTYKWRNAYGLVMGAKHSAYSAMDHCDRVWLKQMAQEEAA